MPEGTGFASVLEFDRWGSTPRRSTSDDPARLSGRFQYVPSAVREARRTAPPADGKALAFDTLFSSQGASGATAKHEELVEVHAKEVRAGYLS